MLRRKDLAKGRDLVLCSILLACFVVTEELQTKSKTNNSSEDKLTNVLNALAPDKSVLAVVNRTTKSHDDSKTKKKDILANVMNQLEPGQASSRYTDQTASAGQVTEVTEQPRDYDLSPHRRMEEPGSPRVINLPGMINVFGPPPKSRFAPPHRNPLHVLELPGATGHSQRENYEVVPPHFNSENIPVHFYPNVRPPEITGGHPQHLFLPFPKHEEGSLHARGLHHGIHGGFRGGLHGGFQSGFQGGFRGVLHGGFHGLQTDGLNEGLSGPLHGRFHESDGAGLSEEDRGAIDGYRVAGIAPFPHQGISEFSHFPSDSGVPLAAADQFGNGAGHVNIEGHEMGRFITMPSPSITHHPPKHLFEAGKEITLDNGREIDMNNEMHVVEHGHHRRYHPRIHVDDDNQYSHYDDHDNHGYIGDHGDDQVMDGPSDEGDSYDSHDADDSHGSPVSVADPEHVVHEHHSIEHHHHFGKHLPWLR